MSIGMILHLLAQDRTMLIEALLGNILICIVVYTLFGKRKYDWFFPIACAVRYIFTTLVCFPYGMQCMEHRIGIKLRCQPAQRQQP